MVAASTLRLYCRQEVNLFRSHDKVNLEVYQLGLLGMNTQIKIRHNCKVFTDILRPNSESLLIFCHFLSCFLTKIIDGFNKDRTLRNEGFDPFSHTHIYVCSKRSVIWPQVKGKQIQDLIMHFLI